MQSIGTLFVNNTFVIVLNAYFFKSDFPKVIFVVGIFIFIVLYV